MDDRAERRVGRGQRGRRGGEQRGHVDGGVDRERQAQRQQDRPRNRPGRFSHLLAERRDPRVAGKRKEEQPARAQHSDDAATRVRQVRRVHCPAAERGHDEDRERGEHHDDDRAGHAGGLVDPGEVHRRQSDDRARGEWMRK